MLHKIEDRNKRYNGTKARESQENGSDQVAKTGPTTEKARWGPFCLSKLYMGKVEPTPASVVVLTKEATKKVTVKARASRSVQWILPSVSSLL